MQVSSHEPHHSALPSPAEDTYATLAASISNLSSLIEEQTAVLRRMDQRREAADKSRQPMPEVPATSSSAWNALLRSTLSDAVQPKTDGWRSGLDALLVFLGLFSAIVTAFIIPSLASLQQDETVRTNELLANITDIIIAMSDLNVANLNLRHPTAFVPDSSDVRLNVYLSLSLIFSLSIAALAIACRGFTNLVSWSNHTKAVERLTEIRIRWKAAERILGPAIESLPQLLIIPVLLFILGLLDSLFSTILQLSSPPISIIVTSSLSALLIAVVAALMGFAVIDGSIHPTTSPFQSRLAHVLHASLVGRLRPVLLRIRKKAAAVLGPNTPPIRSLPLTSAPPLSLESINIYHEVLQAARDDDILDQASAALLHVIGQRTYQQQSAHRFFKRRPVDLLPQECSTLLHLLSPEASVRSHRTAAQVIVDVLTTGRPLKYSQNDVARLLPSLSQAARRAATGTSLAELWDSAFLRAMSIVANTGANVPRYPPAIVFLGSPHWLWKYLLGSVKAQLFSFIFEVLDAKITQEVGESDVSGRDNAQIMDAILSSPDLNTKRFGVELQPQSVFASLLYLPDDLDHLLEIVTSSLIRIFTPGRVIPAVHEHVSMIQESDWLHLLGHREYSMVPRVVSVIAKGCLDFEGFEEHESLARLCATCLLDTPSIHSSPPAGFVFYARPLLAEMLRTLQRMDLPRPELSCSWSSWTFVAP
ncbi:hypothetical protein B0H10DRAFT_2430961 [Mycena sp. CBHHK59/15]|nr:hypothetical protein B0H10DRAFT_2430961 [Mycena sp. CBHHK59/15]